MRKLLSLCLALLITQAAFAQEARTPEEICADAVPAAEPATREFTEPAVVLEPGVDYRAIICTDAGPIYIDLLEGFSPLAVNSFVFLAQNDYYNNTTFHRVIANFMAQGGDPTGTGRGGPGYQFANENTGFLTFDRPGWLAMANAGQDTNGSQFFITTAPYPSLDFGYTIFGEVLEGQENVAGIRLRNPETDPNPGTALNTVVIITDPASVATTYEAPEPATSEEINTVMAELNSQLPPSLTLDEETSGIFTTAEAAASAPEVLQSDLTTLLESNHHEFRAAHHLTNTACDLQTFPYLDIGITLDRFATPEEATAVLQDGLFSEIAIANGYTETTVEGLDYPIFTRAGEQCERTTTEALTFWQRGHFTLIAEVTFPADAPAPAQRWLHDVVGVIYESLFSDALRREIR